MGNWGKGVFIGCFCIGCLLGEGVWGGCLFKEGYFFFVSVYFWILFFVVFYFGLIIDGVVFLYYFLIWNYGGKFKKGGVIKLFMLVNLESCNFLKL